MTQPVKTLADEIIRLVTINRTVINGLSQGYVVFRSHQGLPVEITASNTLRLSNAVQLTPLNLKSEELE